MKVTRFDREQDLVIVKARVWGPRNISTLSLVLDTGAVETTVTPEIIEALGYSARDGEHIARIRSAVGKEEGYTLRVKRFAALGFASAGYCLQVFDLATGDDIDGLIGLSFLRQF